MKPNPKQPKKKIDYTPYYVLEGEGGRFGLCICLTCGSAIIIDNDDSKKIHDKWHESLINSLSVIK